MLCNADIPYTWTDKSQERKRSDLVKWREDQIQGMWGFSGSWVFRCRCVGKTVKENTCRHWYKGEYLIIDCNHICIWKTDSGGVYIFLRSNFFCFFFINLCENKWKLSRRIKMGAGGSQAYTLLERQFVVKYKDLLRTWFHKTVIFIIRINYTVSTEEYLLWELWINC